MAPAEGLVTVACQRQGLGSWLPRRLRHFLTWLGVFGPYLGWHAGSAHVAEAFWFLGIRHWLQDR